MFPRSFFGIVAVLFVSTAFAGSSQTNLLCKSSTGRTTVDAYIPGDAEDAMVKFTVDGKSMTFLNGMALTTLRLNGIDPGIRYPGYEVAAIGSANDVAKKVITVQVLRKDTYDTRVFSLVATPASVKITGTDAMKGKFQAVVEGFDPRDAAGKTLLKDPVTLTCRYDYSI